MKPIYWISSISTIALGIFIYLILGDAQKTVPKIKLSYFIDEKEIAKSVTTRLSQELEKSHFYWIGLEPEKDEQVEVMHQLVLAIKEKTKIQKILLDDDLKISEDWKQKIQVTEMIKIKENWDKAAEIIFALESKSENYILITASIYSTTAILKNPIHYMKEKFQTQPTTFSFAYMPLNLEDEKNMLFPCATEDYAGTSSWGCLVASKSRAIRRKIKLDIPKSWIGLMDLTGETDYMLLLRKK